MEAPSKEVGGEREGWGKNSGRGKGNENISHPDSSPYFLLNRSWTCSRSVLAMSILESLAS